MSVLSVLNKPVSATPLALFRLLFGSMMFAGCVRFWSLGWIEEQYLQPVFHFPYYGFSWVKPLSRELMYALYFLMTTAAFTLAVGYYTQISAVIFFLLFTYFELIDLTYYLNHYYFVSLIAFWLCWLPAGRVLSLDVKRNPGSAISHMPAWILYLLRFQVAIVYVYAGLAKMNVHWLFDAMPLKIWLPAQSHWPVVGPLLSHAFTPWIFSWAGMLFDIFIVFILLSRFCLYGYLLVIVFHSLTGLFFPIGMFPWIMMLMVWIFFPLSFLEKVRLRMERLFSFTSVIGTVWEAPGWTQRIGFYAIGGYLLFQLIFPFRYLLYPGDPFWTEQGYRYGWRVMLMEKSGQASFYVRDKKTGREWEVMNRDFLNAHQEKQMSMQPDMLISFAHFLADTFSRCGLNNPSVRVEARVTLNGMPSQLLLDPKIDLTTVQDGWEHKSYILPSPYNQFGK
jgi:hypothetical protein